VRTRDGVLVLETLLWPDEVRAAAFPFLDDAIEARPQELRMASSLIESMTVDFDPGEYHDSYREALQELVAAKTEGREVVQPEAAELPSGESSSLADALRASLTAARGGSKLGAVPAIDDDDEEADEQPASKAPARRRATPAKAGTAKASPAKASSAKASPARAGSAKAGTAKAGTAKASPAKTAAAKTGAAKTAGTSRKAPAKPAAAKDAAAAPRRPRRAS
jgi:DNA end-binding protein Ku